MKATEKDFPVVIMLYKVVSLWVIFLSVTIHIKATKQFFSCGAVYYPVQGAAKF